MILLSPDAVLDVERVRGFLEEPNPEAAQRALATIWHALEKVQTFPNLGVPTPDAEIRQIVVRFGRSAYVVRYIVLPQDGDILVTLFGVVARCANEDCVRRNHAPILPVASHCDAA